jgi:hypothetical protein
MKITKDNIDTLENGDVVYMPFSFKVPEKYIYAGLHDNGYHYFINKRSTKAIKIFKDNFESNWDVNINGLYSTYAECCEKMRELCINTIEHFNSHQLKNNPIKFEK